MSMLLCAFVCLFGYALAEKVIIIGAGASGIATASRLLDQNITDFIILEAENRIGGRIYSVHFGEAYVDLGAQFVHGEKGNLAFSLAKEYVVHDPNKDKYTCYFDGKRKTGETLLNESRLLYDELADHVNSTTMSIGEAYLSRYNSIILSRFKDDPEMTRYAKSFLRVIKAGILSMESAFDWYEVIAKTNFIEADGDLEISWNGLGYKTILDILLKNFPNKTGYNIDDKILFEKTVTRIEMINSSVEVECRDGSKYSADHVVFTPSLGVLKNNHKNLFIPELNTDKVNMIENFGFGGIMSVVLEFPNDWWRNENRFILVWNDEDLENLKKDIPYGPKSNDDHWLSWFSYIGRAPNNPHVLIGWFSGPFVKEIENLSGQQLGDAIFYALNKHLGRDFNVTKPKAIIHSKWCTNPNFLGTYTYETVKMIRKNITIPQKTLSDPITGKDGEPRILFAGEATHSERFGTVDGAIGSGYREGDRLIRILKK